MEPLRKTLADKQELGIPALVTFMTAGYPSPDDTVSILLAMQQGGADVIELGIPFSDPVADGPTVQKANLVALGNNIDYATVLRLLKEARSRGLTVPVLLKGYYNPILAYGEAQAIQHASDAGANGFIIIDLPPEEAVSFREMCLKANLSYVPFVAISTSLARMKFLASIADSFIYVVSKMGATDSSPSSPVDTSLPSILSRVRSQANLPLAVDYEVSTREQFDMVSDAGADAVVIGSKLVSIIEESPKESIQEAVEGFCRDICRKGEPARVRSSPPAPQPEPTSLPAPKPVPNGLTTSTPTLPPRFGEFGGQYVPEILYECLASLESAYKTAIADPEFWKEFESHYGYMNRPSKLYYAESLTRETGGAGIWLKREDLNHTGSHKINNAVGQILLARRTNRKRVVAGTGAGQHGVATATVCARFGMECVIYMGSEDVRRQALNVFRMEMLGAKVISVAAGSCTLKDAVNEALRDWVENLSTTHYLVGSAFGPHPFPTIVRDFQRVIGREIKEQFKAAKGKLPDAVVACVGGGSNSIGTFYDFIEEKGVRLIGVEAGGEGIKTNRHGATLCTGHPGVFHGARTYILQTATGQIAEAHTIAAGLGYPGVGPEHAWLKDSQRAEYVVATDEDALRGFRMCTQSEGIIPALESAHAIWAGVGLAKTLPKESDIVICLSGRGDKDVEEISQILPGKWADILDWHIS